MDEIITPQQMPLPPEDGGHLSIGEAIKGLSNRARLVAAAALLAVGASGCSIDRSSINDPPTQHDVAASTIGDISFGAEADNNGLFNGRKPIDVPNGQYEEGDDLLDRIGGLPNAVVGIKDPTADDVPRSDGNILKRITSTAPGKETIEIVPGGKKVITTPRTVNKTSDKVVTGGEKGNTQYERDFNTDIRTFEQALTPAEKVTQETLELIKNGYTVTSVRVTGRASGEDHTVGSPTANLGEPSENNIQLAEQRGYRGTAALKTEMEKQGVDLSGVPITIGGVEVEPTMDQMTRLTAAAETLGMSVSEMTERFNMHLGGLSPDQAKLLMETLTNNRGVAYEIHASKTERVEDGTFITTVIQLPPEIRSTLQPDIEKNAWLFRIELPGEVLLVLAAIGLGLAGARLAGSVGLPGLPGGSIRLPRPPAGGSGFGPRPGPGITPPGPPGIATPGNPPIPGVIPPTITRDKPPIPSPPPSPPPPKPRRRQEILSKGPGRTNGEPVAEKDKRPRPFNMGGNRGSSNISRARGGRGRMTRDRGGSKGGRRR
jgi:hypothetical protein